MNKLEVIRRKGPQAMKLLMAAFQSFKKMARNGRQAEIRIRNSPDALEQAWRLNLFTKWIDAYLPLGDRKVAAPAKFAKVWEEFNDEYRDTVRSSETLAIRSKPEGRDVVDHPKSLFNMLRDDSDEMNFPDPEDKLFGYWDWRTSTEGGPTPPYFDAETEFSPGRDDPIKLIEFALDYFDQQSELANPPGGGGRDSNKIWDAWDYLKDTLGLDTENLWERWTTAPLVLSQHVGHPTISDLFDEAVRCYAFGQFSASMAMCRALLEDVLGRLYGVYAERLQDQIVEAEHQFGELRRFQLVQLKTAANSVLHNHSQWRKRSKEAEKLVLQFLETLKAIIEDADAKKKR